MSNIFFTSDSHFGHKNIASKNGSQWKSGWRPYKSLQEHDEDLVKSINKIVGVDDTLYHLGDWSFGGIDNIWKFRSQLQCQNIHLILGNHDHHIENDKEIWTDTLENCQSLFSSVSHYKEVNINGRIIVMSHYGMRVWHGSHKGWFHLYGHSHGSLPMMGKSMDVGVDVAIKKFKEPRPFYFNEVVEILDKQLIVNSDHHEQDTNTGRPPKHI
jgi:calcineurin-like phosphoesterase family protein